MILLSGVYGRSQFDEDGADYCLIDLPVERLAWLRERVREALDREALDHVRDGGRPAFWAIEYLYAEVLWVRDTAFIDDDGEPLDWAKDLPFRDVNDGFAPQVVPAETWGRIPESAVVRVEGGVVQILCNGYVRFVARPSHDEYGEYESNDLKPEDLVELAGEQAIQ